MYDRWFCFSTCKNNLKEGTDKLKKNQIPETAFSVEQDLFKANQMLIGDVLKKLQIVKTEEPGIAVESSVDVFGVKVYFGPKIIIHPSFAATLNELNEKISGEIRMTEDSTLILEGDQTSVTELYLDGYLHAKEGIVHGDVKNFSKFVYLPLKENEGENYEKIRGYTSTQTSPK